MAATPITLADGPPWAGDNWSDAPTPLSRAAALGAGVAAVAHELRGPLAAILYALEAMPRDVGPAVGRARSLVERQARQAARVVDDLFDVAAGGLGTFALRPERLDVAAVVAAAVEATRHLVTTRGHQLTVSLPAGPVTVQADPVRLEQVLANLVTNAAKFTDPGGHIRVAAEGAGGGVVFRVADDGRGIAPHLLPSVFDLYARGDDGGRSPGLGLGLALVKTLVELHGGSVAVRSDGVGRGAEFVVRLPAGNPSG